MTQNRNVWLAALTAICLVYILLRFWNLTQSCLWFDEIFSVHAARHDWGNLFGFVAQDLIHPPLFYVLLKLWISAGGESLFWLRFFPVLFSILSLVPFFFLRRELKISFPATALALFFLATNGALIKYSQEVRMYSVFLFFALFSYWIFVRYFYKGKNIWILTLLNILLIYTHYFGWFVVLSEIAAIAVLQRIKIRQMAVMLGILLVSFAPWFFEIWKAAQATANVGQNIGWIARPDLAAIFQFVFDLIEPFYFQASSIDLPSNYLISIPILLIFIAAAIIWLTDWRNKTEDEKQQLFLLLILIKMPVILALAASWILPYSIWGTRHLIFVFVPTAILFAVYLSEIKIEKLKPALVSAVILLSVVALTFQIRTPQAKFIWCAWENLAENLDKKQPATVYVFEDLVAYHFWFAVRESDKIQIVRVKNVPGLVEDSAYFLPRGFDAVPTINETEIAGEKFYVAFRDSAWNEKHQPLRILREKGYTVGEPKIFETVGLKAFLVEVSKR